ncbi:alpha/beta fold hydrolase [Virgibacillus sp. NKC19-3]|uniref:alpha/beta fold hydrolase n=1 Tax=Virgibacillus saliphilus TaxID=2831674 RepID=UPI001C9A430D|nr:alpha/beta fold hydrolase [Virgibacillus sp. NKC19-3]MBY7142246.1 alpha/beta fold hydrolase [Virgibacillus sp. NKC19-3]
MNKKIIISLTSSLIMIVGVITILYTPSKAKSEHYSGDPTVFVHGYKGTSNSFGFMLDRFENSYQWGNKALVYYVSSQGRVEEYNLNKGKQEPAFVQVVFENNRASIDDTTYWLSSALHHMKESYSIDSINLVGHSMGGITGLQYLQDYAGGEYPNVTKLVTIGSPFNGIYSHEYFQIHQDAGAIDLKPDSLALQLLHDKTIPENTNVLSVGSTGDTVAMPESVQAIQSIVPSHQLEEIMIENKRLGHSALHESKQVDKIIHSFLWQDDRR